MSGLTWGGVSWFVYPTRQGRYFMVRNRYCRFHRLRDWWRFLMAYCHEGGWRGLRSWYSDRQWARLLFAYEGSRKAGDFQTADAFRTACQSLGIRLRSERLYTIAEMIFYPQYA